MNNNSSNSSQNDDNTEIIEKLEKKIYDLKNLIGLGISLSSNLEFSSLVESILYSCIGQMVVDRVAIFLQTDLDDEALFLHMFKGYDSDFTEKKFLLKENSQLIKYFKTHPDPHEFSMLNELPELGKDLSALKLFSPELFVPMKSKNNLNGIMILSKKLNKQKYTANEKEFMQDLAKFAAIAVENSRLYLLATLDRMTKLYIHHYFQERLHEEIKKSRKEGTPICIIMADIDHFKKFNDTYGHQQGDTVLKETAKLFKKHLRNNDIPCRYGGEEFSVILPGTEIIAAAHVAERLREEIEAYNFPGQDKRLKVTISLGVTQFNPDRDSSKKDLIKRADEALYMAKAQGRNKVVTL